MADPPNAAVPRRLVLFIEWPPRGGRTDIARYMEELHLQISGSPPAIVNVRFHTPNPDIRLDGAALNRLYTPLLAILTPTVTNIGVHFLCPEQATTPAAVLDFVDRAPLLERLSFGESTLPSDMAKVAVRRLQRGGLKVLRLFFLEREMWGTLIREVRATRRETGAAGHLEVLFLEDNCYADEWGVLVEFTNWISSLEQLLLFDVQMSLEELTTILEESTPYLSGFWWRDHTFPRDEDGKSKVQSFMKALGKHAALKRITFEVIDDANTSNLGCLLQTMGENPHSSQVEQLTYTTRYGAHFVVKSQLMQALKSLLNLNRLEICVTLQGNQKDEFMAAVSKNTCITKGLSIDASRDPGDEDVEHYIQKVMARNSMIVKQQRLTTGLTALSKTLWPLFLRKFGETSTVLDPTALFVFLRHELRNVV